MKCYWDDANYIQNDRSDYITEFKLVAIDFFTLKMLWIKEMKDG